jgi:phosphate transport system substrate-binding protein
VKASTLTKAASTTATRRTRTTLFAVAITATMTLGLAACGTDDNTGGLSNAGQSSTSADSSQSSSATNSSSADSSAGSSSAAGGAFEAAGFTCATGTLRSSGSTAQGKVMAELITSYNAKCGATIGDYGGGGSGKGITDFVSGQTDFGGSDSALKDDDRAAARDKRCEASDAIDLPMVTGPIAVAYHLSGVDKLVLTPNVLSGIFGGTITTWNDAAISAINPGVTLPDLAISTVHRAEDSGTTDNFTKYLAAAGGWTFEGGKAWTAPGGIGAQGSDGVAKAVADTEGSIGYVEWGFATQEKLTMAEIDNGSGPVALTAESAGKAVAAATVVGTDRDLALKLDYATSEAGAYPIILVTYEIVCAGGNGDAAPLLKSFLGYAVTDGQALFADLGAAPLPESIRAQVETAVKALA